MGNHNGIHSQDLVKQTPIMARLGSILAMAERINNLTQSVDSVVFGSGNTAVLRAGNNTDHASGFIDAIGSSLEDTEHTINAIYNRLIGE